MVTLHCDIYHAYEKVGRLDIENGTLQKYEVYTDNALYRLCPEGTSLYYLLAILQQRVLCKERCTEEMLATFGLQQYDYIAMLKDTHGVDVDDFMWLRFDSDDENLSWDDLRVR